MLIMGSSGKLCQKKNWKKTLFEKKREGAWLRVLPILPSPATSIIQLNTHHDNFRKPSHIIYICRNALKNEVWHNRHFWYSMIRKEVAGYSEV